MYLKDKHTEVFDMFLQNGIKSYVTLGEFLFNYVKGTISRTIYIWFEEHNILPTQLFFLSSFLLTFLFSQ